MPMSQVSDPPLSHRQPRSRISHRKSRTGCVNCRFRHVKCSEEHPSCRRCVDYRVSCTYNGDSTKLLSFDEQISDRISVVTFERACRPPCRNLIQKTHVDDGMMYRFTNRTVHTFGTPETVHLYLVTVPRLAVEYDYLRHTIYATTLVHDRALSALAKPSAMEAYYLNQAARGFNQKLSTMDYKAEEKDALWATAVYLCAISASSIESETSTYTWPMTGTQSANLNWLNMQRGLRTIWMLTQMNDRCTALSNIEHRGKFNCAIPDAPNSGVDGVPPLLRAVYKLDQHSTPANHPYHAAVCYLSTLLPVESTLQNTLKFLIFAGGMTNQFQVLLQQKDHLALSLMGLWYTKLFRTHWFMSRRATVECQSIHQYLQQQEQGNQSFRKVMDLLQQACSDPDFDIADRLLLDTDPCNIIEEPQEDGPTSYKTNMFWL